MADSINLFSLFTGSGMLDTSVQLALSVLGLRCRAVGYAEWDAAAASILLARMEAKTLEPAPIWHGSIADLDARPLRGFVDLLIASPPCQPYSAAGKRRGNDDHRSHGDGGGPLPHTIRIYDECRPALGFFENVPEWWTDGHFQRFGEELCRMGYDIAPPFFCASGDVGGSHGRERGFCMVYRRCAIDELRRISGLVRGAAIAKPGTEQQRQWNGDAVGDAGATVGDAEHVPARQGEHGEQGEHQGEFNGHRPTDPGGAVADGLCWQQQTLNLSVQQRRLYGSKRDYADAVRSGAVADGDGAGLRAGGKPQCEHGDADKGGDAVAHPQGPRCQGRDPARCRRPDGCACQLCRPLCPPGRPIFDVELARYAKSDRATLASLGERIGGTARALRAWTELFVAGLDPSNAVAVEPDISVVVDEMAYSASDLLRIGGNGVDPLVAAYAFATLFSCLR